MNRPNSQPLPPLALVWHDRGQTPVAARQAAGSLTVELVVPPWAPEAPDGGRTALLESVRDARERIAVAGGDPNALGIVGFGLGAVAAASLARHAKRLGIGLGRVVVVDPRWAEPDPISGDVMTGADLPASVVVVQSAAAVPAAWLSASG